MIAIMSCKDKKDNNDNEPKTVVEQPENSYTVVSEELLKNVDFNRWDNNAKPSFWEINEEIENPEKYVVDRDTLDLLLNGHKDFNIFLEQKNIEVEPNAFYKISTNIISSLKNDSYAGIIVSTGENILAKKILENNINNQTLIFNSKNSNNISCFFGFIKKGNGNIKIKSLSLKKVDLNNAIFDSSIAQFYHDNFETKFEDEKTFDQSVEKILKATGDMLLSEKRKDTINISLKNNLIKSLEGKSFLKKYFNQPANKATHSFATKQVYSAIEILNEFNIGSQRVEFFKKNKRMHLGLKYYNPYSDTWKYIDPFYNSRIQISGDDFSSIDKNNITKSDFGGLSNSIEGIIKKYKGAEIKMKKEKIIGYPY